MIRLLESSQIKKRNGKTQDAYSLRCIPQVHGIINDTLDFVEKILSTELNSVTDNPIIVDSDTFLCGGNFHGEYPAKAADYLAIAISELGLISERRIERLVNSHLGGLPSFLVPKDKSGLNSGFMIVQYTAAALASENKSLCHPASADSIPTCEGQEDHVSMGAYAARKALKVVENVEFIVAIELLVACQALEENRNEKSSHYLEKIYTLVRSKIPKWDGDRMLHNDINAAKDLLVQQKIAECCKDN